MSDFIDTMSSPEDAPKIRYAVSELLAMGFPAEEFQLLAQVYEDGYEYSVTRPGGVLEVARLRMGAERERRWAANRPPKKKPWWKRG